MDRVIFGTARLHHCGSYRDATDICQLAIEKGFYRFDTAPLYGANFAEKVLGDVGRGNPLAVATKVGLSAVFGITDPRSYLLTKMHATTSSLFYKMSNVRKVKTRDELFKSLDNSLRLLGSENVKILFLHEPALFNPYDFMTLVDFLYEVNARSLVPSIGLCGEGEFDELNCDISTFDYIQIPIGSMVQNREHHKISRFGFFEGKKSRQMFNSYQKQILQHLLDNRFESVLFSSGKTDRIATFATHFNNIQKG